MLKNRKVKKKKSERKSEQNKSIKNFKKEIAESESEKNKIDMVPKWESQKRQWIFVTSAHNNVIKMNLKKAKLTLFLKEILLMTTRWLCQSSIKGKVFIIPSIYLFIYRHRMP